MTIETTGNYDLPLDVQKILVDARAQVDVNRLHEAYAWARTHNPVGYARPEGFEPFWVLTKHADISAISRDNERFHNGDKSVTCRPKASVEHIVATTGCPHIVRGLPHIDGEEHKSLRSLTQAWFMPNSIQKLDARFRKFASAAVEKLALANGQSVDFAADVALHYPLHVIMDILGIPPEDEPRMLTLTQEMFSPEDPELRRQKKPAPSSQADMGKALMAVVADFEQYFKSVIADRHQNPRNDVATLLSNAVLNGKPLTDAQLLAYFLIIATAGHDTTSSSASVAMWALTQHPELLSRLQADPSLIAQFVDETIRIASPVRHFMRTAMEDTEIRGRTIRKGDWMMLCYPSANRDEEVFEKPYDFNIERKPNRHLAFGIGGHVCLGQHLAKMEIRILFEELIPRLKSVELSGPMDMTASFFIAGPKHLPVRCVMQ
ncbi:cytochrome P450 [Variovorax boronicumulans]|uniref:Cytochrome P450 n=1 Tax=Variovorax boronicumulans TaxID=436515 RepID=A0AAW8DUL3_9BURK|nr:cytochrome P450 [Variovorax boronicumulans]MDP9877651.1 cytochrome P450 [Variovorax boronicumulans]MDP9922936.1 cytochrome P450 [Variovorax boronicumulans]